MDTKVANWILNFLLRKPVDDKIINAALSCFPFSDHDRLLKKSILLRRIESEINSTGSISEKLLDFLEFIEELDHRRGKTASDLLKKAYSAVAVDCTVRFLDEIGEENGKYFEAVERVWKSRVCKMKGLISEDSTRWLADIESAGSDSSVCERVLMINTRSMALKVVKDYLKEAWRNVGPSFLETLAIKVGDVVEDLPRLQFVATKGMQKGQDPVKKNHVAIKSRSSRGAKIFDADDKDFEDSMKMADDVHTRIDKVQELLQSNSMLLHDAVSDPCSDASRAAHSLPFTKVADYMSNATMVNNQTGPEIHGSLAVNLLKEVLKTNPRVLHASIEDPIPSTFQAAQKITSAGAICNQENAVGNTTRTGIHAIHEVDTLQRAHKSSSMDVHVAVRGPCPDITAENMSSVMATNQVRPGVEAPTESTVNKTDNVLKKEKPKKNSQGNKTHDPEEQCKRKRSLMGDHGSSDTFEWDDMNDNCLDSSFEPRSHPSSKRREKRFWSPLEVKTFKAGVKKYGIGYWKDIHRFYHDVFKERTEVDLKDKWRNMTKSADKKKKKG